MLNHLLTKATGTIAPLLHSCAFVPPPYAFLRPSTPKRLLHNFFDMLKEFRHHGSDRVWPHCVNDDKFHADFQRIAAKTSASLGLPIALVKDELLGVLQPRMEPLIEAKMRIIERLILEHDSGNFTNKIDEHGRKLKTFKILGLPDQVYPEYKGEWKFRGSQIAALPGCDGYGSFKEALTSARPEGFADDPEEMGGLEFPVVWSTDGMDWYNGSNEYIEQLYHMTWGDDGELEFQELYQASSENEDEEITVLFMERHLVPLQEQDLSLKQWVIE